MANLILFDVSCCDMKNYCLTQFWVLIKAIPLSAHHFFFGNQSSHYVVAHIVIFSLYGFLET